ncbi:Stk1 family PASTA domain-containing Ser/Thr kinase [Bogoriella caseilytica]|uniref:non-specific serine/threonine protein kinase n=1 Tax=Bogoriella caseilytica TaxID=56055 RepID=A0A3N2BCX3_9MICO|nr:Stk1 family PASTA domain-containing Ser/Thr kinase [Bogoriella caseilytica]ROR72914.1 serine/threonine-protein kinase [Bogoriella caseilytica]
MADEIPRLLGGRYEIGDLIGRGGMAEVHIGYDTRLSRTVAVKILRSDLARDATFQARFRREAQSSAALNHPAIVAVYDTAEDEIADSRGQLVTVPYIVMEYVEGHTVRSLLASGDPVPIEEAAEIVVGVLSALEYSHREGIVHRDVKPGNIMITPTGQVKVMDFGIARAMADSAATMTQTNAVVGTAQYLSPEQARGEVVDARSDLYSTGCLLFELLTGQPPFQGDSAVAVAYQHVREMPRTPSAVTPDIPEALDRVVLKALAKDREERYSDAAAMRADLRAAVRGDRVEAPATAVWAAPPPPGSGGSPTQVMAAGGPPTATMVGAPVTPEEEDEKRSRWWVWLLLVIALLAIVGVVWALVIGNQDDQPAIVEVPSVAGLTQVEARQALEDQGLILDNAGTEASEEYEEGQATRSDPEAGEQVEEGSTVEVWFSGGPDDVEIPDIIGLSEQAATAELQDAGLVVGSRTFEIAPEEDSVGSVLDTDPAVGQPVAPGTAVNLVLVSEYVQVPDLSGMTQDEAASTLEDNQLRWRPEQREDGDADPGTVVDQSEAAGSEVSRNTQVTIYIATEPEPELTRVPDLSGMDGDEARAAIESAGLVVGISNTEYNDDIAEGIIIRWQPSSNSEVEEGTAVDVWFSDGPEPEPEPTDEPTEDPTDDPPGDASGNPGNNGGSGEPGRSGEAPGRPGN